MNGAGSNKPPPAAHPPGPSTQDNPTANTDPPRRRVMSSIPAFEGYHMRPDGSMPAFDFNRRLYLRLDPQRINDPGRLTPDDWFEQFNAGRRDPGNRRPPAHIPSRRPAVAAYADPDLPRRRDKSYHYHCPSPPPSPPRPTPPPPPPPPRSGERHETGDRSGCNDGQDDKTSTPGAGNTNGNTNTNGTADRNSNTRARRRRPPIAVIIRFLAAVLLDLLSSFAIACVVLKLVCGLVVGLLGGGFWNRGDVVGAMWQVVGIAWDCARNGRGGGVLFGATGRVVGVGVHCRDLWAVVWVVGLLM